MTAIYFILFLVLSYYVLKFSMRLLLPYVMKKVAEKMLKKAQHSQGGFTYTYTSNPFEKQQNNNYQQAKDETVRVDYVPQKEDSKKGNSTAGEFIDFEEIK